MSFKKKMKIPISYEGVVVPLSAISMETLKRTLFVSWIFKTTDLSVVVVGA